MLTIASLAGHRSEVSSKNYLGQKVERYCLLACVSDPQFNKELKIKSEIIKHRKLFGYSLRSYVTFYFRTNHNFKFIQQGMIRIHRAHVELALEKAKTVADGTLQVYIEQSFTKFSHNRMQALNMAGYGYGLHKIFLVFDKNYSLVCIRIIEEYRGERILFAAKNLQSVADTLHISQEQQQKADYEIGQPEYKFGQPDHDVERQQTREQLRVTKY